MSHRPDILVAPPLRAPDNGSPDWSQLLKAIARETPSFAESPKVKGAVARLTECRAAMAAVCKDGGKASDINEAFVAATVEPYLQVLQTASQHFPLAEGTIKGLQYTWRAGPSAGKTTSQDSRFELASVMAMLAAAWARIGQAEISRGGVEGAKTAFKCYQAAAGVQEAAVATAKFISPPPEKPIGGDLTARGGAVLVKLFLAHAHHAAFLKGEQEMPGKYALLSKLAAEGAAGYAAVAALAKDANADGSLAHSGSTNYENSALFLSTLLKSKAHMLLAREQFDKGGMGAAIARANAAIVLFEWCAKVPGLATAEKAWAQGLRAEASAFLAKSIEENDTVYGDRVPKDLADPEGLGGKMVGKPTAFKITPFRGKADDPFFGIVPLHVCSIAADFKASQRAAAERFAASLSSHRAKVRERLQALGVAAVIEVATRDNTSRGRLPPQLRARLLKLRGVPAAKQDSYSDEATATVLDDLVSNIDAINNVRAVVIANLTSVTEALDTEEHEDAVRRNLYGERVWGAILKPVRGLPEGAALRGAVDQFLATITKSVDEPLKRAKALLTANLQDLCMLDWPLKDLDALMPFAGAAQAQRLSSAAMAKVGELQQHILSIEENEREASAELENIGASINSDEIAAELSSSSPDQREAVMEAAKKAILERVSAVSARMNANDALVGQLQEAMAAYAALCSADPLVAETQKVCSGIENSVVLFEMVAQDARGVSSFLDTVAGQVESTLETTRSFVAGRRLQMTELAASLEAQVASRLREMQTSTDAARDAEESRKRQEALRQQLAALESGAAATHHQQQQPPRPAPAPPSNPPSNGMPAYAVQAQQPHFTHYQPQQQPQQQQQQQYQYQQLPQPYQQGANTNGVQRPPAQYAPPQQLYTNDPFNAFH